MKPITRRSFGKHMLAAALSPTAAVGLTSADTGEELLPAIPDVIAGHTLSVEEKTLAAKFLADHEKEMSPLRQRDLPNSLPPDFMCTNGAEKRRRLRDDQ